MATPSWASDLDVAGGRLEERAHAEPYRFEFFQAVRLLQQFAPEREPVGSFANPSTEVVRFGSHASLAFPASQNQSLARRQGKPPLLIVNFLGLTGPLGILPLCYTALVIERLRAGDSSLQDFLDLFNHRMISLFYQAWEKYRFAIAYERGDRERFTHHLLDLIGLGTRGLEDRQEALDESLLYYSGLLAQQPRSATALRQILSDYFDVPVEIEQFAGAWYRLDADSQCCLEDGDSFSEQLGVGAVVGDEIWTQESRVRIRLGPLGLCQYLDFLPNGTAYKPLRALTKFFANAEFEFEVQLILKRDEVPRCELGAEGDAAPQLGWVTWMKSVPPPSHPGDTLLQL